MEIKLELCVSGCIYEASNQTVIDQIELDENRPKVSNNEFAMIVYYSDGQESVWDIARAYNTSVEAVMRENDLESDTVSERKMLLIPM